MQAARATEEHLLCSGLTAGVFHRRDRSRGDLLKGSRTCSIHPAFSDRQEYAIGHWKPVASAISLRTNLNNWFRTLALKNQISGGSRTFIAVADNQTIAGYYCLSSFTIAKEATGDFGVGFADPIPAVLIEIDTRRRSRVSAAGSGTSLLQHASAKARSHQIGSAAIAVSP
ncbi:MAG: hypothetical protein KF739_08800 [Cryobacterium sp.]|nr:hypothetical protein [Cryobacterium sp.]